MWPVKECRGLEDLVCCVHNLRTCNEQFDQPFSRVWCGSLGTWGNTVSPPSSTSVKYICSSSPQQQRAETKEQQPVGSAVQRGPLQLNQPPKGTLTTALFCNTYRVTNEVGLLRAWGPCWLHQGACLVCWCGPALAQAAVRLGTHCMLQRQLKCRHTTLKPLAPLECPHCAPCNLPNPCQRAGLSLPAQSPACSHHFDHVQGVRSSRGGARTSGHSAHNMTDSDAYQRHELWQNGSC